MWTARRNLSKHVSVHNSTQLNTDGVDNVVLVKKLSVYTRGKLVSVKQTGITQYIALFGVTVHKHD